MKKKSFKRGTSMLLALLMCFSTILGLGTTAFAAGEQTEVYMIGFPRDGDANYGGEWGSSRSELYEWLEFREVQLYQYPRYELLRRKHLLLY